VELAIFLACCVISVGCGGGSTASNRGQNNIPVASGSSQALSISGSIGTAQNGNGATVTLSGAANATTTADSFGNYSFTGLSGGSYSITPSKSGYAFSPSSQSTTLSVADITGIYFVGYPQNSGVDIYPGQDISSIVNVSPEGTTFVIHPGTYRLTQPITPKNGDNFLGQTACDPISSSGSCPAIISGSREIGSLATFNGTSYQVTGQTQQGVQQYTNDCYTGFAGCFYPEDLYFDGVQLTHLYAASLPSILTRQWWFDYVNHIIYFHDNPSGHLVETSVAPAAFEANNANNITFQYLTIEEFASPLSLGAIEPHVNGSSTANVNWVVRHTEIWGSHAIGVHVNFGTQVYDSYLHHNGQLAVGGGSNSDTIQSEIVVQGSTISNNNTSLVNDQWGAGGMKFGSTLGAVFRKNTILDNYGAGIHMDDNSADTVMDGNLVSGNLAGGIYHEIGIGANTIIRNNIVKGNPREPINGTIGYQIASVDSSGIDSYCNLVESSGAAQGESAITIAGTNRVWNGLQMLSTANNFHHNTVIVDSVGPNGLVRWFLNDAAHQPNFFSANPTPDYNSYELPSLSGMYFVYDNNGSQANTLKTWAQYEAAGADPHGAADTNYTSGYPTVVITSPTDQSTVALPATVTATASDTSGISKMEFYLDWTLAATVTSAPYNFTYTSATAGPHVISAMAYSNAGIRACYAITLNQP
jgi:hypothetical protein